MSNRQASLVETGYDRPVTRAAVVALVSLATLSAACTRHELDADASGSGGSATWPEGTPAAVRAYCASCHRPVLPQELRRDEWRANVTIMRELAREAALEISNRELAEIISYYERGSTEALPALAADPQGSWLAFQRQQLPFDETRPPGIANVAAVDLDQDGLTDIVAADVHGDRIVHVRNEGATWSGRTIAAITAPGRVHPVDYDADGDIDLAVAVLGELPPTDDRVGSFQLMVNVDGRFVTGGRVAQMGRVSDVRSGDLDGDGDIDFVVAEFGHRRVGSILWLEQVSAGQFAPKIIATWPGAIDVPVADIDRDGDLDIVAVVSQEREQVIAFINDGFGEFVEELLYAAPSPTFGSSGIEVVDLDGDGDHDVLHTNGDSFDRLGTHSDDLTVLVRPQHGVRWLENLGDLHFEPRHLASFHGAYRATAGDLDGDGDLDVVVASLFNDWSDPARQSLIWLEQVSRGRFVGHGLGSAPTHLATAALADFDGDGMLDIVAGGLHAFGPWDRVGSITLWYNQGAAE